jgi:crotonobetaine/carnitine-CoA ligase
VACRSSHVRDRLSLHSNITSLFRGAVHDSPEKTWLSFGDESWTFHDAQREISRLAAGLRERGVRRGDRVVVTARNEPPFLFCWLALMELGAIEVPVNPAGTVDETAGLIGQVRPALVVADSELEASLGSVTGGTPVTAIESLAVEESPIADPEPIEPGDLAVMIPTSGTTGRSKLVMQTHRAYVVAGEGFPWWLGLTDADRLMTSLPLFHINAPAYSVLGSVSSRAGLVLLPRFSASRFLDQARRHEATEFNAIGAMLEILMAQPERPDDADNPLRLCYTGPSPTRERQLEIEARFGFEIVCGYALSESPLGLIWRPGTRPFGTLGWPRQHPDLGEVNEARVIESGREVAVGEVGELELRNPVIMKGYFEMPEETEAALVGGWLRTGDLVRVNADGTCTFVARRKEVIRRRGENLSPAEVEECLERHPDVAVAAVIGVPSDLSEEDVKAFVMAAPGRTVDASELHRHVGDHLARFKVPRYFEVVDDLPQTPTGRIAKHRLPRERTSEEIDMESEARDESTSAGAATGPDASEGWLRTSIGSSTPDTITVAGRDLPSELMGHLSLTELVYLLLVGRDPTAGEWRMVDAVLVSLADHGLTPSALSTRLTYTGAPEAVQGAVAAGLLGAGSVFLGPAGDTAQFLADGLAGRGLGPAAGDDELAELAREMVAARLDADLRVPGLGHPVHRDEDPRTPRLYEIARQEGVLGPHLRLLEGVGVAYEEAVGRRLPINGAGAGGAALVDVGMPPAVVRGVVLIARAAGLVAHLAEEIESPLGMPLWREVDRRIGG